MRARISFLAVVMVPPVGVPVVLAPVLVVLAVVVRAFTGSAPPGAERFTGRWRHVPRAEPRADPARSAQPQPSHAPEECAAEALRGGQPGRFGEGGAGGVHESPFATVPARLGGGLGAQVYQHPGDVDAYRA